MLPGELTRAQFYAWWRGQQRQHEQSNQHLAVNFTVPRVVITIQDNPPCEGSNEVGGVCLVLNILGVKGDFMQTVCLIEPSFLPPC